MTSILLPLSFKTLASPFVTTVGSSVPSASEASRSASWLNRFMRLLIRWEKKAENYLALVQLACSLAVYRRTMLGWL